MKRYTDSVAVKMLSVLMSIILLLSTMAPAMVFAVTDENAVAEFDSVKYESLKDAITAIDDSYKASKATPDKVAEIKLLKDTAYGFDVGVSDGTVALNLAIDLNGKTLTLKPPVGSAGTVTNGIRVLAYSKLSLINGNVVCSDAAEDVIKVGIANYGTLVLDSVNLKSGAYTIYTINNRGSLTLSGSSTVENGKVCQSDYGAKDNYVAITNDPYSLYYNKDAEIICSSTDVKVGNLQLETYGKTGEIVLDISAGSFGEVTKPETSGSVTVAGNITGGNFGSDVKDYCADTSYITSDGEGGFSVAGKVAQSGFGFDNPYPLDQWVGDKYINSAVNSVGTGTTVYSISEGTDVATINSATGELTFVKEGKVTVVAENPGDAQTLAATAKYTVNAVRKYYTNLHFEKAGSEIKVQYSENLVFENAASCEEGAEGLVYSIVDSTGEATIDSATGKLSIAKAGIFTVRATMPANTLYLETYVSYTLVVESATQSSLAIEVTEPVVFSNNPQFIFRVTGGNGIGAIEYSIAEGFDVAEINSVTGAVTTLKSGTFKVKIEKKGDVNYNSTSATVSIFVEKAEQKDFGFAEKAPAALIWDEENKTFANPVTNVLSTTDTVYEIVEGGDVAEIDAATGELTLIKAGTVVVSAKNPGDDRYNSAEATYTLTVGLAEQSFDFADGNSVEKKYGTTEYNNIIINEKGPGAITYSIITEKSDDIGASIDSETGIITIKDSAAKTGKITVKATKAGDDRYSEYSAEYQLNVSFVTVADGVEPTFSGKVINGKGWYVDDVTISAPEGFEISFSGNLENNRWSDSVTVSSEGVNVTTVYLKNSSGYITDAIRLKDVKIDKTTPFGFDIIFKESFAKKFLEKVTFGIFKEKEVNATIVVTDAVSGIDELTYYLGDTAFPVDLSKAEKENGTISYSFKVNAEFKDTISATAADTAGHTLGYYNGIVYVIDATSPFINVNYITKGGSKIVDSIRYFNDDVTVKFAIKEENFELVEKAPTVTVDGEMTLSLDWKYNETDLVWEASQAFSKEGDYSLKVEFTDASGNSMDVYTSNICVDKTLPVVSVSAEKGNTEYAPRILTVKVNEENFDCSDVNVDVIAQNITGAYVSGIEDYEQYAKNPENWNSVGSEHTLELPVFDVDAIYTVDISYTDSATNEAPDFPAEEFIVDTTAPENINIEYSDPVIQKIIKAFTFGFYDEKVRVTVTVDDITSGVDKIEWMYNKASDSVTDAESYGDTITADNIVFSEDNKTATVTFDVPAQARGYISVVAYDKAGNSSDKENKNDIKIVDKISPEISVVYNAIDKENTTVTFRKSNGEKVDSFEEADVAYYSGKLTASIIVNESNFFEGDSADDGFVHEIGIRVVKTDNEGVVTEYEYLPENTEKLYEDAEDVIISWTHDGDSHSVEISFEADADYVLYIDYADFSGNKAEIEGNDGVESVESYKSKVITVDTANTSVPVVDVQYNVENKPAEAVNKIDGIDYFNKNVTAIITVKEHNFRAADFVAEITSVDVNGTLVQVKDYAAYLKNEDNWTTTGNVHTATIDFVTDANYTFDYSYADLSGNAAAEYDKYSFTVDKVSPAIPEITYSTSVLDKIISGLTFGFYKEKVDVTVTSDDFISGVEYFTYTYTKQEGSSDVNKTDETVTVRRGDENFVSDGKTATITFSIPAAARGTVSAKAADRAGNESQNSIPSKVVVTDVTVPAVNVSYRTEADTDIQFLGANDITVEKFTDAQKAVYGGTVIADIVVNEANFFEGEESENGIIHSVGILLTKTDADGNVTNIEYLPEGSEKMFADSESEYITWITDGDKHSLSIEYSDNAEYVLTIKYSDFSENDADISSVDGIVDSKTYTSKTVIVDTVDPEIVVEYAPAQPVNTIANRKYFNDTVIATITVTERNFRASDFVAEVTAFDISGDVEIPDYAAYLADQSKWSRNGNVYTATLTYDNEANYTFSYKYKDLAGNEVSAAADEFTVDRTAPENLKISYSEPIVSEGILDRIFNFYKETVEVTITVDESVAGIDSITWSYTKEDGTSDINKADEKVTLTADDITEYINDGKTAVVKFIIDASARGYISATATDNSKNSSSEEDVKDIRVVDNVAPQISVEYTANGENVSVQYTDADNNTVEDIRNAANIYFNSDVTAKIVVNEANFFEGAAKENGVVHEIGILLTKIDADGNVTKTEYLPVGAEKMFEAEEAANTTWTTQNFVWATEGDAHSFEIKYSEDVTDYILQIVYYDFSENKADISSNEEVSVSGEYVSKTIAVDKTAPVVDVQFEVDDKPAEAVNKIDSIDYFNKIVTATITVTAHNFRASDFNAVVTAKDVTNTDVQIMDYVSYCKNPDNWTQDGNVYSIELVFDADANYTFDYSFESLAQNKAADYKTYLFTVDKTAPENLKIDYSTSVLDKIIETLSFGFYKAEAKVTITVDDATAGVDSITWTYTKQEGSSEINKIDETVTVERADIKFSDDNKSASISFTIPAEARGNISAKAVDRSLNESTANGDKIVVVDTVAPKVDVFYKAEDSEPADKYTDKANKDIDTFDKCHNAFYDSNVVAEIVINEANFFEGMKTGDDNESVIHEIGIKLIKTDNNGNVYVTEFVPAGAIGKYDADTVKTIEWTTVEDKHSFTIEYNEDADYVLEIAYTDYSENDSETVSYDNEFVTEKVVKTYTSKVITVDKTAPVITVDFDPAQPVNTIDGTEYYNSAATATVTVNEHNFRLSDFEALVSAVNVTGAAVAITDYNAYFKNPENWTNSGNIHTIKVPFEADANYAFDYTFEDLALNTEEVDYETYLFTVDKTIPEIPVIKYSTPVLEKIIEALTFGYYQAQAEVTVTVDDITSGIDTITRKYIKQTGSSVINAENSETTVERADIKFSDDKKTATISFMIPAQARGNISVTAVDRSNNSVTKNDASHILITDTIAPTREVSYTPEVLYDKATLTEITSFKEGDNVILGYKNSAKVVFTVNEANFYAEDVVIMVNNKAVAPVDWTQNGDVWTGSITITGSGDYTVTMEYKDRSDNKMVSYTSPHIAIDGDAPVITVIYDNNEAENVNYYKADRTATIVIKEHNFRADDIKATVTAKDIQGNEIAVTDFASYLRGRENWTSVGDTHTAKITYSADARYTFDIEYVDMTGNAAADYKNESFIVDHKAPDEIKIEYSQSLVQKIFEKVTFGFYKPQVKVTVSTADAVAGVDYITYTYTQQSGTSDVNKKDETVKITSDKLTYSENGKNASYSFVIPAQARGYISAIAVDRAGYSTAKSDNNIINIVDNISPEISVVYTAKELETECQFIDSKNSTVDSFEAASGVMYNGNVIAQVVVKEANFFEGKTAADGVVHEIGIKLTKTDDEGSVHVTEFVPAGANGIYNADAVKTVDWTTDKDTHSFTIEYAADGDYVLEIAYTDFSGNTADINANDGQDVTAAYKSKVVTVDKTAPVVSVEYGNKDLIQTIDSRQYFDKVQSATIVVKEHNFRAADFKATVIAKNIIDNDVEVENFAEKLSKETAWTKDGNTYTAKVDYKVDANYTFDYEFCDLAKNVSSDYAEDLFTVDTTSPVNLNVEYETSILDKILETITFGYYNAEMKVTISADDETSPINRFVYSYKKSEGVSDVNAELIDAKVDAASKSIVYDGKKATVEFKIPKDVLVDDNQFNGTVSFTAFDRSENSTDKDDTKRIIVDNIKPTAVITYSEPVQISSADVAYYAGNIDAKLVITEANFYSEDVSIIVTKDGTDYPVNVAWTDDSVDVHTGTFTLTEDGDYIITVNYKDRSENTMDTYTSNRLTIDTKVPAVHVNGIVNNTANKDEVYGFTLTAQDINIDVTEIKPVLTAVVRNDDGTYSVRSESLGNMQAVTAGETYSFTVGNLPDDAYYTLSCIVKDMAGNEYNQIVLEDGSSYNTVEFSVNREGSVFNVNKTTNDVVDQYYVYDVYEDIVIEEVNVDPIESYVVLLNGKALKEGKDYEVSRRSANGEWSKITYTIHKDLFAEEGEYSIVVESVDKTQTTAYSDVKALKIAFVVDKTAPVIVISGLETLGRYHVEQQEVTLIPTDDGGRLNSLKVVLMDSEGKSLTTESGEDISVAFGMEGEEFLEYLNANEGKVTFVIPTGLEMQVQIICNDCSSNDKNEPNEYNEVFEKVTVSASGLIIYYANKPLFYGSIAGVCTITAAGIFFVIYKRRKEKK